MRLETDGPGKTVTEVVCETAAGRGALERRHRGAGRRRGEHRLHPAGARPTRAHPNGLANGSDQVGPQLRVPHPDRHGLADRRAGGHDLPQDPGGERLLLEGPARRLRLPDGPYPAAGIHVRQDAGGARCPTGCRRRWCPTSSPTRWPSGCFVAGDLRGPADAGQPGAGSAGRPDQPRLHAQQPRGPRAAGEARCAQALDGFVDHAHPISQHHLELDSLLPLYGTAHQVGTTRFGTDPKSSVLDPYCKAHELDNLYVVDSSFFVSAPR